MIIAAKAAIDRKQIVDRKNRGANYIELHTLPTYFLDKDYTEEIQNILEEEEVKCICVHAPINNIYKNGCGIGYKDKVSEEEYKHNIEIIKKSILMADKIIDMPRKIVVIHPIESYKINVNTTIEKERKYFEEDLKLLSEFTKQNTTNVYLAIENTIRAVDKKNKLFRDSLYAYNDDYVKWIEKLDLDNVGVILDTCHAIATAYYNKETGEKEFIDIEEYINAYSKKLIHMHLSNSLTYGFGKDHGRAFLNTKRDVSLLKKIENTLNKIGYTGNITIETVDKDIYNYERYSKTVETMKKNNLFKKDSF